MYNILICDDERDIVNALKIYLSSENYNIFEAYDGQQAVDIVSREEIHLVLLDIMMPKKDGYSAIADIRKESNIPVIMITAKSEDTDKILGLNIGADDYITKPFNPVEVIARVKSQLRRYAVLGGMQKTDEVFIIGGLKLDDKQKIITNDGDVISLTPIEYEILKLLMSNPGKVFSSEEIYKKVWKAPDYGAEGTVPVHIRHIREKVEIVPSDPRYLKVVWGRGYTIRDDKKQ
ncbi:MAG: response regulator transcription factor [Clostridia bacterium]|nr:response regulator transcription factor [Clostridia bacterium]